MEKAFLIDKEELEVILASLDLFIEKETSISKRVLSVALELYWDLRDEYARYDEDPNEVVKRFTKGNNKKS